MIVLVLEWSKNQVELYSNLSGDDRGQKTEEGLNTSALPSNQYKPSNPCHVTA